MAELFIEGFSEYQLQALRLPANTRTKCLPQLVDYSKCKHKAGVARGIFQAYVRFLSQRMRGRTRSLQSLPPTRVHIYLFSVNYSTACNLARWKFNNPSAFDLEKVSPTLQENVTNPTFLNFHR